MSEQLFPSLLETYPELARALQHRTPEERLEFLGNGIVLECHLFPATTEARSIVAVVELLERFIVAAYDLVPRPDIAKTEAELEAAWEDFDTHRNLQAIKACEDLYQQAGPFSQATRPLAQAICERIALFWRDGSDTTSRRAFDFLSWHARDINFPELLKKVNDPAHEKDLAPRIIQAFLRQDLSPEATQGLSAAAIRYVPSLKWVRFALGFAEPLRGLECSVSRLANNKLRRLRADMMKLGLIEPALQKLERELGAKNITLTSVEEDLDKGLDLLHLQIEVDSYDCLYEPDELPAIPADLREDLLRTIGGLPFLPSRPTITVMVYRNGTFWEELGYRPPC